MSDALTEAEREQVAAAPLVLQAMKVVLAGCRVARLAGKDGERDFLRWLRATADAIEWSLETSASRANDQVQR